MDLVIDVYQLTELFPKKEKYVLDPQIRRSAISIPSNIAEGRKLGSKKDYARFLMVAFGSGAELETQIEIAKRLTYGKSKDYLVVEDLLSQVMRMLNKMISNFQTNS